MDRRKKLNEFVEITVFITVYGPPEGLVKSAVGRVPCFSLPILSYHTIMLARRVTLYRTDENN